MTLEVSVTFDERRGYVGSGAELRAPVVALSLSGLRRRIEALLGAAASRNFTHDNFGCARLRNKLHSARYFGALKMKWRRGFFRLWVIFAAAWLAGTIAVVAPSVREQWKLAQTMKEFDDAGFVTLVPTDCQLARGREGADYERREAKCWYELPGFRRLFPEYADLADKKLRSTLYQKAGILLKEAEPMKAIGELLFIGLGIPLLLLGVGFVLAWALRGFSTAH